jgi:hypothetical protein
MIRYAEHMLICMVQFEDILIRLFDEDTLNTVLTMDRGILWEVVLIKVFMLANVYIC